MKEFEIKFTETILTMLASGAIITVSAVAKEMRVDRNSIYYRINKLLSR